MFLKRANRQPATGYCYYKIPAQVFLFKEFLFPSFLLCLLWDVSEKPLLCWAFGLVFLPSSVEVNRLESGIIVRLLGEGGQLLACERISCNPRKREIKTSDLSIKSKTLKNNQDRHSLVERLCTKRLWPSFLDDLLFNNFSKEKPVQCSSLR